MKTSYWQDCSIAYKDELLNNIMPFWMKHGFDKKNGGVYTCVDRDGTLMDTTKSVWIHRKKGLSVFIR